MKRSLRRKLKFALVAFLLLGVPVILYSGAPAYALTTGGSGLSGSNASGGPTSSSGSSGGSSNNSGSNSSSNNSGSNSGSNGGAAQNSPSSNNNGLSSNCAPTGDSTGTGTGNEGCLQCIPANITSDKAIAKYKANHPNAVQCNDSAANPNANCDQNGCDLVKKYINPLINVLSAIVGLAAVISIVAGAIQYMTSTGDPQKTSAAKNRISKTIFALVAYAFLYAFLQFIIPGGIF